MEVNQTPQTDAQKAEIAAKALPEASQQDGKKPEGVPAPDEVLAVLNDTLKRNFPTRDEAVKSLTNLNSLVGDNALAELREKAKDADHFAKVVSAYASSEGITRAEARTELLKEAAKSDSTPETPSPRTEPSALEKEVKEIRHKLQEKELVEKYPEAKSVLGELKELSGIHAEKDLMSIYEGSGLKEMATKAAAYETEKSTKPSNSVPTSSRMYNPAEAKTQELVTALKKSDSDRDRVALVEHFFTEKV